MLGLAILMGQPKRDNVREICEYPIRKLVNPCATAQSKRIVGSNVGGLMKLPFVRRRRYEDDLLDADRKINQLTYAAGVYREERDRLRAILRTNGLEADEAK